MVKILLVNFYLFLFIFNIYHNLILKGNKDNLQFGNRENYFNHIKEKDLKEFLDPNFYKKDYSGKEMKNVLKDHFLEYRNIEENMKNENKRCKFLLILI
jgi:hypothetical protein